MLTNQHAVSRRDVLRLGGAAAIAALAGGAALGEPPTAAPAGRKRAIRLAHLTDFHVQPELKAGEGMAACLKHMMAQKDKPEMILTGGDMVMDAFGAEEARTKLQWELWKKTLADGTNLPLEHCLGNHDIWGWNKKASKTTGAEALYGKKWAAEQFGVPRLYRSFDRAGWHFVILDSIQPHEDGYRGRLDEEQFAWLEQDLKQTPAERPVLLMSHIPIASIAVLLSNGVDENGDWRASGGVMHQDAPALKNLFKKHANVKACVSGHLHHVDRVEYLGVTYLCDGAVCGGWWKGPNQETEPGYAMLDLYADGSVEREYVTYGWKAAT